MEKAVLLRQRFSIGSGDLDLTSVSLAPNVAVNRCRAKLAATRSWAEPMATHCFSRL